MQIFNELDADQKLIIMTEVANSSLKCWRLADTCDVKLLGYRENAVFKVTTADGQKFALRVHRHDYHTPDAIRSEMLWTQSLSEAQVYSPLPIAGKDGEFIQLIPHTECDAVHTVDLLEWFGGSQPAEGKMVETFKMLGKINARIHKHARTWKRPDGFNRLEWDEKGLLGDMPNWGKFSDLEMLSNSQISLLNNARDNVLAQMISYGKSDDNYGLIHADLMPENIMINGDEVRVIDFDDGGFGWNMYDPATAFFMVCEEEFYPEARMSWLDGYQSILPLSSQDLQAIDALMVARGLIVLGWAHTRGGLLEDDLIEWLVSVTCNLAKEYLAKLEC